MKFKNLLNTIKCTTLILLACQNGYSQTRGTVDGGGANGIKSQLIESQKLNPNDYNEFTKAFINLLEKSSEVSNSNYDFKSYVNALKNILNLKKWYLLPHKIDNIGTNRHGIPVEETNQFAVHQSEEVFVSEVEFITNLKKVLKDPNKIKVEQNKIIFHEMIMGLRLLFKENLYTQCVYANVKTKDDQLLNLCRRDYEPNFESEISVNPQDHVAVRFLTDEFINIINSDDDQANKYEMIEFYFKKYNLINTQINPNYKHGVEVEAKLFGEKIYSQMLKETNKLFCGHNKNITQESLADWEMAKKGTQFKLKSSFEVVVESVKLNNNETIIEIKNLSGDILLSYLLKNTDKVRGRFYHTKAVDYGSKEVGKYVLYDINGPLSGVEIGDKKHSFRIEFDDLKNQLISIEAQNYVVYDKKELKLGSTTGSSLSSTNILSEALVCSDKSIIIYEK